MKREQLDARLRDCGLELHPEKTRVVYCKDSKRTGTYEHVQFDFLGYAFRPRRIVSRGGRVRTGYTPAVSRQSMTGMRQSMRRRRLSLQSAVSLEDLAHLMAPQVRGWIAYYCRFRGSEFQPVAEHLDRIIVRWAMRKYKRLRGHKVRAFAWLDRRLCRRYHRRREPHLQRHHRQHQLRARVLQSARLERTH
ncbi:MAG: group II intron maturase-specific domain-containing protein [Acidiferrobacterales bacterium]